MKIYIHCCDQCGKRDCTYGEEYPRPYWWHAVITPAGSKNIFCSRECLVKFVNYYDSLCKGGES